MTVKQKQKSNMANVMHDSSLDLLSLVADVSSYYSWCPGWLAG